MNCVICQIEHQSESDRDIWGQCIDRDGCTARYMKSEKYSYGPADGWQACRLCNAPAEAVELDAEGLCRDMEACRQRKQPVVVTAVATTTSVETARQVHEVDTAITPTLIQGVSLCATVAHNDTEHSNLADMENASLVELLRQAAAAIRLERSLNRERVSAHLLAGSLLLQARQMASRGEWGTFLAEHAIPRRTAARRMRLARAYGTDALAVIDAGGITAAYNALTKSTVTSDTPADTTPEPTPEAAPVSTTDADPADEPPPERVTKADAAALEAIEMKSRIAELEAKTQIQAQKIARLEAITDDPAAVDYEHLIAQMETEAQTLRSQIANWMERFDDLNRAYKGALRRIADLEKTHAAK